MFLDTSVKYQIHQQKVVSVSYLSFHIYIIYLGCVLYLLNLVFRLWIGLEPILHNSFMVETQHFLKTIIAYMIIYLLHMTNQKLETLVQRKKIDCLIHPLLGIMVLSF
jgi:hypothetical protein